jgi:hypothetical protein
MGWTFTNKGGLTTKEFFEREFNHDKPEEGRSGKVIACHATWTVAYLAYETLSPKGRQVVGVVCLLQHVPRALDGYTFGYKDMSEEDGPCESKCPKTILDMLTPTTSEYALQWRKRCQERIDKRAKAPKVKKGEWVKFTHPLTFRGGETLDTLQYIKGNTFYRCYTNYRISNWKEREYVNLGVEKPDLTLPVTVV